MMIVIRSDGDGDNVTNNNDNNNINGVDHNIINTNIKQA